MQEPEPFLTSADASRVLNRTPDMIRVYARRGRLPHTVTAGGVRLFRRADVLALKATLAARSQPSRPAEEAAAR